MIFNDLFNANLLLYVAVRKLKKSVKPTCGQKSAWVLSTHTVDNKKLSCCQETARRESQPKIAEMDVEITTQAEMTFKCT